MGESGDSSEERAILIELEMRSARYCQLPFSIIDKPAAIAEKPDLVKRLHRLRARRMGARAACVFDPK